MVEHGAARLSFGARDDWVERSATTDARSMRPRMAEGVEV
jgi:hypothetical protein